MWCGCCRLWMTEGEHRNSTDQGAVYLLFRFLMLAKIAPASIQWIEMYPYVKWLRELENVT